MTQSLDALSASAMIVFVVGVAGLFACMLATGSGPTRRTRWRRKPQESTPAPPAPRRAITGAPARERLAMEVAPARQLPLSPDVHRRERARKRSDDDLDFVLQLLDSEPERVVEVVERWLAEDAAKALAEAEAHDSETRGRW